MTSRLRARMLRRLVRPGCQWDQAPAPVLLCGRRMRRIEEADVTFADSGGDRNDVLDIAVIGAGFSGLAAARALTEAGLARIAVLEARDRVGGRAFNDHVAGGFPVEMGGTWCGPGQWAVIDLAEELGIALRPQYARGDEYAIVEGQAMRTPPTEVDERFVAELVRSSRRCRSRRPGRRHAPPNGTR